MRPQINRIAPITDAQTGPLPRARGTLLVRAKARDGQSVIADLRTSGSLKALFPQTRSEALDLVFLNTAGGLTGGDVFSINASAEAGSRLTMTSQAAERIYGAVDPMPAQVITQLTAAAGARIDWLPQETILFDKSTLRRKLDVNLTADASFLMVEPLVFGRATMGENVRYGSFADDVRLRRDGDLIFADAIRLSGDMTAQMTGAATGQGCVAMASVLYAASDAAAYLSPLRDMLPKGSGVSLIRDGVLFARLLAPDSFDLRKILCPVIARLQGDALPKPWML